MYLVFNDLIDDLYKLARTSSGNVIYGSTEVKRAINKALLKVYHQFPWPFRQDTVTIQTVAPYSTGTLTATNASRAVTGSGTTWDTSWWGYWLKIDGESEWYEVLKVSSTTALTLAQPYTGTTGASKTYKLYKRLYKLPSIVDDIRDELFVPDNNKTICYLSKPAFDRTFTAKTEGSPQAYTRWGSNHIVSTYSTGTVAGTQGTTTLTGTTTSWLANVNVGDEFEISSTKYNVAKVYSDTSLDLAQLLQSSPSGTSYTARSINPVILEFGYLPDDEYNIEIPCLRRGYNLIDTNDIFYIPTQHMEVVRKYATAEILFAHDSQKAQDMTAQADGELQTLFTEFTFGIDSNISVERE